MYNLTLFFTQGVSLHTWAKQGILEREIAIYQEYIKHGWDVSIVTYGTKKDLDYNHQIGNIKILCNKWNLPGRVYKKYIHLLFARSLQNSDIIKTTQILGADIALSVAKYWNKPLIVRCGYLLTSTQTILQNDKVISENEIFETKQIESDVFTQSNKIIVTTEMIKGYIQNTYNISSKKISVVPNYVQTNVFKPDPAIVKDKKMIYIGRLNKEKNLENLIEACSNFDIQLDVVGGGILLGKLKHLSKAGNSKINFLGNVPNSYLPKLLNRSMIFVLVSHYEGHPKALIEAMSCGMPVIGSNVSGIKEIIAHKENGFLCDTSSDSIRKAIIELMDDEELRERIAHKAREFALSNYSLDNIFLQESNIMIGIIEESKTIDKSTWILSNQIKLYLWRIFVFPLIIMISFLIKIARIRKFTKKRIFTDDSTKEFSI